MRNETYTRLAHRKATLQYLQRVLKDKHLETDSGSREPILCEEVLYADRVVSQDALYDVLDGLQMMEAMEIDRMNKFELRERNTPPLALPPPPKENVDVGSKEPAKGAGEGAQQGSGAADRPEGGGGSSPRASDTGEPTG